MISKALNKENARHAHLLLAMCKSVGWVTTCTASPKPVPSCSHCSLHILWHCSSLLALFQAHIVLSPCFCSSHVCCSCFLPVYVYCLVFALCERVLGANGLSSPCYVANLACTVSDTSQCWLWPSVTAAAAGWKDDCSTLCIWHPWFVLICNLHLMFFCEYWLLAWWSSLTSSPIWSWHRLKYTHLIWSPQTLQHLSSLVCPPAHSCSVKISDFLDGFTNFRRLGAFRRGGRTCWECTLICQI